LSWLINRDEWESIYRYITSKLRLSFNMDQEATDILSRLLDGMGNVVEHDGLRTLFGNRGRAIIFGCGGSLTRDLKVVKQSSLVKDALLIAADGATSVLLAHGIRPDIVATDLDGYVYDLYRVSEMGAVVIVHAHGDNIVRLEKFVKGFKGPLSGSTQVEPRPHVYNYGGFTDGDRSAFIAYSLGIREIHLAGFDLQGEPSSCPGKIVPFNKGLKKLKLEIADYMLKYLSGKGAHISSIRGDAYE